MSLDVCVMITDWLASTFTGNYALNNLSALFTIGAIIIAPASFFIKRKIDFNAKRKKVSKSLHEELKDGLKALDGTSKRQVMEIEIDGEKKYYTLTFMNYDMYDSLIASGEIQSLNSDLQQDIQDIFRRIKGHREYLKEVLRLGDMILLSGKSSDSITNGYYSLIADYETELEEMIPKALRQLKENF